MRAVFKVYLMGSFPEVCLKQSFVADDGFFSFYEGLNYLEVVFKTGYFMIK